VKVPKKRLSVRKKTPKSWIHVWSKLLKDHLLPHKGNKHLPHALRHKALFGYSAGLILLKVFVIAASLAIPSASLFSSAITQSNIVSLTNETRENTGLSDLSVNESLSHSAQMKAEDMRDHNYFAHTSPDGVTPWSWFGKAGYSYKYAGENLAVYFTSAEDVYAGWLASPTHKANIVDKRYTEIGVGVASGEYNGFPAIFVVQHFGYPKGAAANVAVKPPEPSAEPATETPAVPAATTTGAPAQAVLAEVTENTEPSAVDEGSVRVTPVPEKETYTLTLKADEATKVTAHLGTASVKLEKQADNSWKGDVPYEQTTAASGGEQMYVVTENGQEETVEPVAVVAPASTTADMYAFKSESGTYKLFGVLKLDGLKDQVREIYLFTMLALGAILVITLISKFNSSRIPLAAHALAVIMLAVVLSGL
jgi:hypothetical protein